GGRVVGLTGLAGNTVHRGYADNTAAFVQGALFKQRMVDAFFRRQVDVDGHLPPVFRHIGQGFVAGDTGVVDDDVTATHGFQLVGNLLRCVGRGNIPQQHLAADLRHYALQICFGRRNIQPQYFGAIPGQGAGNGFANAARRTGHQRHLTGQRLVPVGVGYRVGFTHDDDLTIHITGFGGNNETEGGIQIGFGTFFNVNGL